MTLGAEELQEVARRIRIDIIDMTTAAGSGHPGGSLSSENGSPTCRETLCKIV